jgi:hypothetical protein
VVRRDNSPVLFISATAFGVADVVAYRVGERVCHEQLADRFAIEDFYRWHIQHRRKSEVDGVARSVRQAIKGDPVAIDLDVGSILLQRTTAGKQVRPQPALDALQDTETSASRFCQQHEEVTGLVTKETLPGRAAFARLGEESVAASLIDTLDTESPLQGTLGLGWNTLEISTAVRSNAHL